MPERFDNAATRRLVQNARALVRELLPDSDEEHFAVSVEETAATMAGDYDGLV